jgi:hypothetical protein
MKDMWKVNKPERAMAFLKSILCHVKPGVLHYVNGLVRTRPILLSNISIHKRWISAYKSIQFCLEYEITQSFTVSSSCCVCAWVCAWVCLSMFAWVLQISVNTSLTLISLSFVCSKVMLAKAIYYWFSLLLLNWLRAESPLEYSISLCRGPKGIISPSLAFHLRDR